MRRNAGFDEFLIGWQIIISRKLEHSDTNEIVEIFIG